MMKKMFTVLAAFLLITGTLAAQAFPGSITELKAELNAVLTESTESRYSAGRFGSYVDDYIDVNYYDGEVKTFLFLGGFTSGDHVAETDIPNVGLSAGLATALKSLYLGVYFGGDFIQGEGRDDGRSDNGHIEDRGYWNNYIAVLVGNLPFGALRLDLIMDAAEDITEKVDGEKTSSSGDGITTAVTWGNNFGKLTPHATLGVVWPDHQFHKGPSTYGKKSDGDTTRDEYRGGSLVIKGGTGFALDDTSSLSADLELNFGFPSLYVAQKSPEHKHSVNGPFLGFIDAGYSKTLALGDKLALGIKPKLTLGLLVHNPDVKDSDKDLDWPSETTFETKIGLDAGIQFKAFKKFTFYTGASLNVFDWVVWGISGGDPELAGTSWQIRGLGFTGGTLPDTAAKGGPTTSGNHAGLGLVFAPDEHLSIGCGLNAILDKFFVVDLEKMQIRAGGLWDSFNKDHFLGNLWSKNTTLDLTVSYTF
jgi:hypothetical protein